jgi:hypothetical protein
VLDDILPAVRFVSTLPGFLRRPVGSAEARTTVEQRLQRRGAAFLELTRHAVYENESSPYRALLRAAGCERGDLEALVAREGLEATLRVLLTRGVYLTAAEFKGRRPIRRGSVEIAGGLERLRNPNSSLHVRAQTGGSTGPAAVIGLDLGFIRAAAAGYRLVFEARGGSDWHHAVWGVPGGASMRQCLRIAFTGGRLARWFSQVPTTRSGLHPRYRWSARAMVTSGFLAGVRLPAPRHVPLSDPAPIVDWMASVLRSGGVPHLLTFPSAGVRLAHAARAADVDLTGAHITVSGEPITDARRREMSKCGAQPLAHYGSSETGGVIGSGCLEPTAADDLHLFHDLFAIVQPGARALAPLATDALLFTALAPQAPFVLLNASLGDRGVLETRRCGCPMEAPGWTQHLSSISSLEKLTAGGMTFHDVDLGRLLDEILPARFGGNATHYQLIETEGPEGQPLLRLLVDPAVGPVDEAAVTEAFFESIATGSGVERVMGLAWRDASLLRVERRPPELTSGGKVQHLLHRPFRV